MAIQGTIKTEATTEARNASCASRKDAERDIAFKKYKESRRNNGSKRFRQYIADIEGRDESDYGSIDDFDSLENAFLSMDIDDNEPDDDNPETFFTQIDAINGKSTVAALAEQALLHAITSKTPEPEPEPDPKSNYELDDV
ncbi:hypothetical protein ACMFMG_008127 [Clarireedia jacksonii]